MRIIDVFSYAFSAIKLRKLRAGLTTLGVVIGIAAIVALLSITQGLQVAISAQLQRGFATDTLIVTAGGGLGGVNEFNLLVKDAQTIKEMDNVIASIAVIQRICYIRMPNGQTRRVTVTGVDFAAYREIYSSAFVAEEGEIPLNPEDDAIVIGKQVSDPWGNGTILCRTGDTFEILWTNTTARPLRNETYVGRVAAVLREIGGFTIGGPSDNRIYIPISKAQSFFGTETCEMIIVKLRNDDRATIDSATKAIREALGGRVSVTSSTAILNIISSVFSTVELFLAGIAAISLLVAGIGIMNIMIVSVMERTREIGILKALGMKNHQVLLIFLCEAAIIGLLGTLIGIGAGWSLAQIVLRIFGSSDRVGIIRQGNQAGVSNGITITPVLTPTVILGALVFGLTVTMVFALYPAWKASKLKPVDALRYE
ncbi:MAG: ABC transporter permease [Candidatus Brockarchaeota archaeon]|nr:ABC transporter permease [Candidatus Brockarchaeota archaeon]